MRRSWLIGGIVAVAGLAGGWFMTNRPQAVETVFPEENVQLRLYGLGSVEARIVARIGFEASAAVTELAVDAGDKIRKGQAIAKLHSAEQEAKVARSEASVKAAQSALEKAGAAIERYEAILGQKEAANRRQQQLARTDSTSAQKAEEAQRDVDVAKADLAVANAELSVITAQAGEAQSALDLENTLLAHYTLYAPFDATIVTRHSEVGVVVKAGDPIFTLVDSATIWVQAYVDEERAGQLGLDQKATVRLRSKPDTLFNATISRIGLESDRVNEERKVWLTCSDCPAGMVLGEQAEVRITTGVRATALMVPEIAIRQFDGFRGRVWLVEDGKLTDKELTFGARDDRGRVEMVEPLPEGASIVSAPPKDAEEGRRVTIKEKAQ